MSIPECPYKGLVPYSEEDAGYFFGRDEDISVITANLKASRLTIFYGASGVGKTSVLLAGAACRLREAARSEYQSEGTCEFLPVVFRSWRDDPLEGLATRVRESIALIRGVPSSEVVPATGTLAEVLEAYSQSSKSKLLVILDQFEEYFLYHPHESGENTFAGQLPAALRRQDLNANFLISIREDTLAKLDVFEGRIPGLWDNSLRVEHLTWDQAQEAIEKPIEKYNGEPEAQGRLHVIEPALVTKVLDEIGTGQLSLTEGGSGVIKDSAGPEEAGKQIEAPYLQLVMTRLWDAEIAAGSLRLRLDTLEKLGGAKKIVRTHVDSAMAELPVEEQNLAAEVFLHLVTPSGTKIAHRVSDLAEYAGVPKERLSLLLEKLCQTRSRILRPVDPPPDSPDEPRYEIFHDQLGQAVLDWRKRKQEERKAARSLRFASGMVALAVVFLLVTIWAVIERRRASASERRSVSRALAATAFIDAVADPELTILLLLQAAAEVPSEDGLPPELGNPLRRAVSASHIKQRLEGHTNEVWGLAFSADGRRLATASLDGTARIWDTTTGRLVRDEIKSEATLVAAKFSLDGRTLIIGEGDGAVSTWDAISGRKIRSVSAHSKSVLGLAIDPSGGRLATSSEDGTAAIWDVERGKKLCDLKGHKAEVRGITFSPDGKLVATGSADLTVRVWNATTGAVIEAFSDHQEAVYSVAFSPDGRQVYAATGMEIVLWDRKSEKKVRRFEGHTNTVIAIVLSADGQRLASAGYDRTARIWDAQTGQELFSLTGQETRVHTIAATSDMSRIATSDGPGMVRLWSLQPGEELPTISHTTQVFNDAGYNADASRIVAATGEPEVVVWDSKSLRAVMTLTGHRAGVWHAAFSPDGKLIATGADDGSVKLWDGESGRELHSLAGHTAPIHIVVFNPEGTLVATGSADKTVKVWNTATAQLVKSLDGHGDAVFSVALSPDSKQVASGARDGEARIWNLATGEMLKSNKQSTPITAIAFTPDGKRLATGDREGLTKIYDLKSGQKVHVMSGHAGGVMRLAFSPDGTLLATASLDRTVRVWDTATGRESYALTGHTRTVNSVAFSRDGRRLLSASDDKTIRQYTLDPGELLAAGILNVTRALTSAECEKYLREKSCPESAKAVGQMVAAKHLALEGQLDQAIRSFQAALRSYHAPKLDPSLAAKKLAFEGDVAEAERLATEGRISEAKARYAHVESLGVGFDVSPQSWNNLCWYGALWGHAAEVLDACEKAVTGWKENGQIRDSRGIARVLTGNFTGAVEDFRFFLANYTDDSPATRRRKSWIAPLEKGQNPITPEVIQELFKE